MKLLIYSLVCKTIVIVSVLAFVFGLICITGNMRSLWFLLLVLLEELVPGYGLKEDRNSER